MIRYLAEVSGEVCDDVGADLVECNREDDHMHLLAGYPPKVAVSSLVNSLKRRLGQETAPEAQRADAPGAPMGASLPRRIMPQSTARHHHAVSKEPARTWPARPQS